MIVAALRKLDKVIKEKGSKGHYVMEGAEVYAVDEGTVADYVNATDQSDEEYIYVADGDLDVIYEEKDMVEALASYQQVRQQLKDQRLGRGYYQGKGQRPLAKGKGFGKDVGKTRVHREHLKLRTRCWRCHQIGHISSECTNKPANGESVSSGKTSNQSNSTGSSKSGFFVTTAGAEASSANSLDSMPEINNFWLRNFVEQRAKTLSAKLLSAENYRERHVAGANQPFCGIVTNSFEGVVDTAAEGGLIGSRALEQLEIHLGEHGLRCQWTPKTSAAKGVGGSAVVKGVILIPLGIGGVTGVLETTVVEGDVPLLLPVRLLKALEAVINIPKRVLRLERHDVEVCMRELPSGHMVVPITEFEGGRFQCPAELEQQYDFRMIDETASALPAQQMKQDFQFAATIFPTALCEDSHAEPCGASARPWASSSGERTESSCGSGGKGGSQCGPGNSELAGGARQDLHHHHHGGPPRSHRRLVPRIFGASLVALVSAQCRGDLCGVDRRCPAFAPSQVQGAPSSGSELLHPPRQAAEGWGQQVRLMDSMQGVPFPLGKPISGHGGSRRGESEEGLLESGGEPCNWSDGHGAGGYGGSTGHVEPDGLRDGGQVGGDGELHGTSPTGDGTGTIPHSGLDIQSGQCADPTVGIRDAAAHGADAREGVAARSHVSNVDGEDRQDAAESPEPGFHGRCQFGVGMDSSCHSGETPQERDHQGQVQLQPSCRAVHSEERRPSTGANLLEVREAPMPVLSLGSAGSTSSPASLSEEDSQDVPDQLQRGGSSLGRGGFVNAGRWQVCGSRGLRTWARRQQLSTLRKSPSARFMVEQVYQVHHAGDGWKDCVGFVPLNTDMEVRVWVAETQRLAAEDLFENGKETGFNSKQRRTLNRAFEGLLQNNRIAEVFSPPRIASEGEKRGFESVGSFDLQTGWDLSRPDDRRQMWRQLHDQKPLLIVLCPPCTMFSILQELNFWKMDPGKVMMLLGTGLEHLEVSAAIARWQVKNDRYFLYEHPDGARLWSEACIQRLQELEGVVRIRVDMCMFGLNVTGDGLNKKPTGILSNCPGIVKKLNLQCDGTHFHVPLINRRHSTASSAISTSFLQGSHSGASAAAPR